MESNLIDTQLQASLLSWGFKPLEWSQKFDPKDVSAASVLRSTKVFGNNKNMPGIRVVILDENGAMRVGVFSQDGQATLINYSLLFAEDRGVLKAYLDEVEADITAMLKADRKPGIVERGVQKRIS